MVIADSFLNKSIGSLAPVAQQTYDSIGGSSGVDQGQLAQVEQKINQSKIDESISTAKAKDFSHFWKQMFAGLTPGIKLVSVA